MNKQLKMLIRNSKFLSIERLQKDVAKIITSCNGYGTKVWHKFEPSGLYRARQHNHLEGNIKEGVFHKFTSELEFWNNPPQSCILGRCNDKGESVFYCSNEFEVAIQEVKPTEEYITITSFLPKPEKHRESPSTAIPIGIQYLVQLPALKKFFNDISIENKLFEELDDFLNNLFYIDVSEAKSHLYKLSVAVTKNMMSPIRHNNLDIPMQGLVYSSMARDKKGFNIAFNPNHVISNYYIHGMQTHRILENNDKIIKLQLIRNGHPEKVRNTPDESYNINWYEPLKNGEIYTFNKISFEDNIS